MIHHSLGRTNVAAAIVDLVADLWDNRALRETEPGPLIPQWACNCQWEPVASTKIEKNTETTKTREASDGSEGEGADPSRVRLSVPKPLSASAMQWRGWRRCSWGGGADLESNVAVGRGECI